MPPFQFRGENHKPARPAAYDLVSSQTEAYTASYSTRYFAPRSYSSQNTPLYPAECGAISAHNNLRYTQLHPHSPPRGGISSLVKTRSRISKACQYFVKEQIKSEIRKIINTMFTLNQLGDFYHVSRYP